MTAHTGIEKVFPWQKLDEKTEGATYLPQNLCPGHPRDPQSSMTKNGSRTWAKDSSKYFNKDLRRANKLMTRCSTSLARKKTQARTLM